MKVDFYYRDKLLGTRQMSSVPRKGERVEISNGEMKFKVDLIGEHFVAEVDFVWWVITEVDTFANLHLK